MRLRCSASAFLSSASAFPSSARGVLDIVLVAYRDCRLNATLFSPDGQKLVILGVLGLLIERCPDLATMSIGD